MGVEEALLLGDLRVPVFLVVAVLGSFLSTWLVTSWKARRAIALAESTPPGLKRPPTLPYTLPIIGHLIQFMWDGTSFLSNAATYFGGAVPVQIILPMFSNYVLSGPENVTAYFKEFRDLSTTVRAKTIMQNAFGCPSHLVDQFMPQNPLSRPGRPEGLLDSLLHRAMINGHSGAQLEALTARYQKFLVERIEDSANKIGADWTAFPDLTSFAEQQVLEAAMRSSFGTCIFSVNPTFAEDFWNFSRCIGTLFMGLPRWLNPGARRIRNKMVENMKRWQKYAREHCDISTLGDVEWEPCYGSKFNRERQNYKTQRGIIDETARAAEDLAFTWATSANSLTAATWFLIETLLDSTLKKRVCARLPAAASPIPSPSSKPKGSIPVFDVAKLCSDPLLQSVYAETLRLRIGVLIVREPTRDNYSFRGWSIKKKEILSISTRTEAMNQEVWSTGGDRNPHPLDIFWSDRFIVDPEDPSSGPLRQSKEMKKKNNNNNKKPNKVSLQSNQTGKNSNDDNNKVDSVEKKPYFSLDGLSASWIPYGGGHALCPGRHFAKQEIILATAILLTAYDIELIEEKGKKRPDVDMRSFGLGAMHPDRKIPFRIRRRQG